MLASIIFALAACSGETGNSATENTDATKSELATVDLILINGRVYTMRWPEPSPEGDISDHAPHDDQGWRPDAEAIVIDNGKIMFVGGNNAALAMKRGDAKVLDVKGATIIPGLIDSHTHVFELGAKLQNVDLTDIATQEEAIALVVKRAAETPKGEWVLGSGWDEGAWASNYPDKTLLSQAVPDHPVALDGLHGFAAWVNQAALDAGGITAASDIPVGGEMRLGDDGEPNGLFLNNATTMVDAIVPPPSDAALADRVLRGLGQMAKDGYVGVHEAGVDANSMRVLENLEAEDNLPLRFYAMLSLRDEGLIKGWIAKGPDADNDSMLVTRAVKAYYDGALGSRGARLLEDYSDMPGHRGVSGGDYGFNQQLNADVMKAGFQIGIHAIGDAGNREALDILEVVMIEDPATKASRHRVEHAQVIHADDMPRFADLDVIASMEPPHAMEDKTWAEDRLGSTRIKGAYAWRTLRRTGARLTFNADNPGSDHNIFYGLHSAIARQDKNLEPAGGWYAGEALNVDEAIRAYTSWSAFASFREDQTGIIAAGRWADLTVMDIDPFVVSESDVNKLLDGEIVMTVIDGEIIYERE